MQPKKIWANLGVQDVDQTRKFYRALGFRSNEGSDKGGEELTSFLVGTDDFVVHFFQAETLKKSMWGQLADLQQGNEIMFTLSADSRAEVDAWAEEVRKVGGTIFSEPMEFGDNYYGFGFADPDGHKWNVFFM